MLSFGIYSISTNITSNYCQTSKKCTPNIFNRLSMNNKINQTPYLTGQNYALLFFVILFIIVMQIIRIRVRKVIAKCDHIVDSPSDYAVMVSRMPEGVTENDLLRLVQQRRQYLSEDELEKTNNLNVIQVVMGFKMSSFLQAINENKKAFKSSILQNIQFSPVQLPKLQQPSHISIIIFQTQQGKNLFLSQPSRIQKLLYCFCDPCTPLTDYQILGEKVSVERAPQPDDIIWENTNTTIKGAICRKILYNFVSFLLLCAGGGVQYGLAVLETKFVQENALFYIGIASSLLVAVMNQVIYKFLVFTAEKERKLTQTMTNTNLIIKMGFFLFLNAGIFMVGAKILAQLGSFQLQGTLSTQITQVMILNAITPHLSLIATSYFDVVGFIKRWAVRNNLIFATQMTANLSYERPAPEISYKYGYLIRTLWLTAFYCPLTPIVIPISIVGLLLNFYIQKCLHSSSYRAPNMVSRQQNATALQLMEFVPLIMSFGQLLIYLYFFNFQITQIPLYWGIPIYISLGLSCLQFILPMQLINKSIYRLSQQQIGRKSYKQVENDLEVTYEMVNPGYKSTKKRNRDKILLKYLYSEIEQMIDLKPKQPIKQLLLFSGSKEHHKEGVDEFDPLLILFRNQNLLASFNTNQVY